MNRIPREKRGRSGPRSVVLLEGVPGELRPEEALLRIVIRHPPVIKTYDQWVRMTAASVPLPSTSGSCE
ncbi:hypothetical protein NDU88_000135 [Pleurodeles waltl]|uniref:Uncharacterized protein n=1 Tax=Pleurodeles waltl TaxID=8319 RepID=A0AAV7KLK8_PLEWA|nr:hypothetical protein NDU88_000135 [Pleurodeles waltl]